MVWSILSSFGIFVICTCIYIYIRATTSRQPSFGPRISRTEMSDSDTTGNIRGQSLEKEGGRTSPTEYGIRKRVSTRIRLCHGSLRGPRGVVPRSLSLESDHFSFSPQNFSFITRTEEGEEGLSERYLERLRRYRPSPIIVRFRLGKSSWDGVARGNPRILLITFDKQTRLWHGILKLKGQIRSMHRWIGFTMVEGDAHSYFSEQ